MKQKSFRLRKLYFVAFSLALVSILTFSCRKDFEEALPSPIDRTIKVEEVRDWISSQNSGGISSRSAGRTPLNVKPDFKTMTFSPGFGSNTILVAKVDTSSFQTNLGEGALVSFWKDTSGSIRSTLLCWKKTTSSVLDNTYWPLYQQSKFTGTACLVNDDDIIERLGSFQNGLNIGNRKVRIHVVDSSMVNLSNYSGSIASDRDGYGCYNFGLSWWDRLLNVFDGWGSAFDDFWNWLNGSGGSGSGGSGSGGSGSGDGSGGSGAGTGWGSGGDGWNWTGWGSASSGTGSGSGGTPLWLSDLRKCRTQIFNNMEGNGNQEQLDNPDMCTLYTLFYPDNTLSDEQVQCLYSKSDEIATLTNFLMHHPGNAQAMEVAKFYMNLKCTTSENVSLEDLFELFQELNPNDNFKVWLAKNPNDLQHFISSMHAVKNSVQQTQPFPLDINRRICDGFFTFYQEPQSGGTFLYHTIFSNLSVRVQRQDGTTIITPIGGYLVWSHTSFYSSTELALRINNAISQITQEVNNGSLLTNRIGTRFLFLMNTMNGGNKDPYCTLYITNSLNSSLILRHPTSNAILPPVRAINSTNWNQAPCN